MNQRTLVEPVPYAEWTEEAASTPIVVFPAESDCKEALLAEHTATAPSSRLRVAYCVQSIVTGAPILILDLILTVACLLAASFISNVFRGFYTYSFSIWNQVPALLFLQWLMLSLHQQYPGVGNSPVFELRGVARSTATSLLCIASLNLTFGQLHKIEFVTFSVCWGFICLAIPLGRTILRKLLSLTSWWGIRFLLIGKLEDCENISTSLHLRPIPGYIQTGYVAQPINAGDTRFRANADFEMNSENRGCEGEGFIAFGNVDVAVDAARATFAPVACVVSDRTALIQSERLLFRFPAVIWLNTSLIDDERIEASGLPDFVVNRACAPFLSYPAQITKRLTDILVSSLLLVLLAVPFILISAAIKFFSRGPVFYGSERVGQHGKRFKMWKFRTMVPNADKVLEEHLQNNPSLRLEWETESKLRHDPRIVPYVGQKLRSWSVDELPQLWNVLMGEMSLVGPRPMLLSEVSRYGESYYQYTQMTPGITGLWQVSGRSDTTFRRRVFLVHEYACNWSFWLDIWILFRTPIAVLRRCGAY